MKAIGTQMTIGRAQQIALAVAKYLATREELSIGQGASSQLRRKARSLGLSHDELFEFHLRVTLPASIKAEFGEELVPKLTHDFKLGDTDLERIALMLVEHVGAMVSPADSISKIRRISDETGVDADELREFYVRFILPAGIATIAGWKQCTVSESSTAPTS